MSDAATNIVKAHLLAEAQAGFPHLTRSPSSAVVRFLDYFATLDQPGRDALLSALAEIDALNFQPPPLVRDRVQALVPTNPAFVAYRAAVQSPQFTMGLRYVGLRMRKAMLADPQCRAMMAEARAKLDFTPRDDVPPSLVPDPEHFTPAKAPQLRKLIDPAFRDLFAPRKQKLPGGETEYTGILHDTPIKVVIDFAAMGLQLRYGVTIPGETKQTFVWRRSYEDLWASGTGWDYLTEENAEASGHLLCEHIAQIVVLWKDSSPCCNQP